MCTCISSWVKNNIRFVFIFQDSVFPTINTLDISEGNVLNTLDPHEYDDAMSQIMIRLWEGETDDLKELLLQLVSYQTLTFLHRTFIIF